MISAYKHGRIYHMAGKIRGDGAVSAICYTKPMAINLRLASWTNRPEAVTCPRCKKKMAALHLSGQVKSGVSKPEPTSGLGGDADGPASTNR